MSVFFRQSAVTCNFANDSSWVILSEIEQRIKAKIEAVGTPLKDWDIKIYRGILTGYNDAFIIDGNKKSELIAEDPKSAEIIRPLLRGRDIKRYSYEYADLYLITTFPSLKIDIGQYPAVKQHLISFGYDRLKQTGDKGARKKTNNQWFETQDSINYWEDFYRQKITWGNLNLKASYSIVEEGIFVNAPCPIIVPANKYLLALLNSKLADYYIRSLGVTRNGGYFEYKPMFVERLPVVDIPPVEQECFNTIVDDIINLKTQNKDSERLEEQLHLKLCELYNLTEDEIEFIASQ